ncbi:hypothetical protein [Photobacterium damselae]|uniref:hypothetical protein n=1 Tax=Photobacterium damselae TaxID=38293 RepID=UPI001F487E3C|nr:hypothetical protein [Photobacterium damselae]UKA04852.1 hypothetical protein IHC89_21655 [Photobacterium damselae subsp. damselae]
MLQQPQVTQETVDTMVSDFKKEVLAKCDGKSLAMAIGLGNNEILEGLVAYQDIFLPKVNALDLQAPSLSELFNTEISVTINNEE